MRTCQQCSGAIPKGHNYAKKKFCGWACYRASLVYTQEKALEVMWSQINRNAPGGCWIWSGSTNNMGYGSMSFDGRRMVAVHRLIYQLAHGNIRPEQWCLHKCDTPRCVNPAHIFLGDATANHADMVAKRRHVFGESNSHAILTEAQVIEIRQRFKFYSPRRTNKEELAAEYGVRPATIYNVATGYTWKHLPIVPPSTTTSRKERE